MHIKTFIILVLLSWGLHSSAQEHTTHNDVIIQAAPDYSRKDNATVRSAEEEKVMELVEQYISKTLHEYTTVPTA